MTEGLLVYNDGIVIPNALQSKMLEVIHHGHQGITKCNERAKEAVWWFGIGRDIKSIVGRCEECQMKKAAQRREPLISSPLPERPWDRIGIDLLDFKGKTFLVAMDYYSRYLEVMELSRPTSFLVIAKLKSIFARWGIPLEVVSDNGPQFSSESFSNFAQSYGFKHTTSSPYYPQSNGLAESAVKIAKRILRQQDPCLAIMVYRSTPVESIGHSPSEVMMNRRIRTTLPSLSKNNETRMYDAKKVQEKHKASQQKNEFYYNRRYSPSSLPILKKGDRARIRTEKDHAWGKQAIVVGAAKTPRSYDIQTENGVVRRNRKHIQRVPRDEREKRQEIKDEVLRNNVIENDNCNPDREISSPQFNYEENSSIIETPNESAQNRVAVRHDGTRTRSGRLSIPPDRLNL